MTLIIIIILMDYFICLWQARALSYNRQHIDIYSASWGPDDNGKTVDGPGKMASMVLYYINIEITSK